MLGTVLAVNLFAIRTEVIIIRIKLNYILPLSCITFKIFPKKLNYIKPTFEYNICNVLITTTALFLFKSRFRGILF